jgi:hypothetical protein
MKKSSVLAYISLISAASACDNPFAYSYLPETAPLGRFELEQYTTLRAGRDLGTGYNGGYRGIDLETELEYGLTVRDQITLELDHVDLSQAVVNGLRFTGMKVGYMHRFSNAATQEWGLATYLETGNVQADDGDGTITRGWSAEFKLILQHNFGSNQEWTYATNLIAEPTWFQSAGSATEYTLTEGLMLNFNRDWFVGVEGMGVMECDGFSHYNASAVYVGPTLSYQGERFFANLGALWQVSGDPHNRGGLNVTEFSPFQLRLKVGMQF